MALLDALLFQSNGYPTLGALGVDLPRMGNEFWFAAPARVYRCKDGRVMLACCSTRTGRCWRAPWAARSLPTTRVRHRAARVKRRAGAAMRCGRVARGAAPWQRPSRLLAADCRSRRCGTYAEAARDPHVRERDMLQDAAARGRQRAPITGPAAKFSRTPPRVRSRRTGARRAQRRDPGRDWLRRHCAQAAEGVGGDLTWQGDQD